MNKINKKELHEIFQNFRNKNQNSYNKLYENYYKLVYGIVFSIIKNNADAEDITHEIFTKIYKLDASKLPENHEASWLFTVCKNECLLFFRKSKPNISISEIYEMPENSNSIDDIIDRDYYNKLISGLKEDEKIIVSLKVLSNFTFRKISQVMNIPIGTVQWKYYNAINSLKISIGSLAGAVLAFVIVLARGEFWKKREYLNDNQKNNAINYGKQDDVRREEPEYNKSDSTSKSTNEQSSQQIQDNTETEKHSEDSKENANNQEIDNNQEIRTITEVTSKESNSAKIDGFQVAFVCIGIALFVIFIIFFKKYQQKLKVKSSK